MTSPAMLEAAWQSFLSADVPVATVLAFEDAIVDPEQLARLQRVLRDGRPANKGAAATALRALLDGAGSVAMVAPTAPTAR